MNKAVLLIVFIFSFLSAAFSQNPLVKQWDYRFGGTNHELLYSFQQTSDGGYILGGWSGSDSSGDRTQQSRGKFDYWIIKIDSSGIKEWDKRFGGKRDDALYSLQQTSDGGYILGGQSYSGANGDKTQPVWGACDYWIVKIDSSGNKLWDKRFGGYGHDYFLSLQQTTDGGYILGGDSYSDSSGDKTQNAWQGTFGATLDYWVVKTDSIGNKLWDKRFGGTQSDEMFSLQQTNDGGFILGGCSRSGISGDKTEPSWGGTFDYWIVKIDSLGTKEWDKRYGGNGWDVLSSLKKTDDGGYILEGYSDSGISGDKSQASWGDFDFWIVKIDSFGNKEWDKDFGGTGEERGNFGNISQTSDRGYLLTGTSKSNISGDKTENNLGGEQTWVVKTDSLGIKQWDKTIFTSGSDQLGLTIQTKDTCYAIANYTTSGIAGYKTQPTWGGYDYWIIKFCDSTLTTSITPPIAIGVPDYPKTFSIYPNPASENVTINYHFKAGDEIRLTDVLGKLIFTTKITVPTLNFKLQTLNLSTGIYFLKAGNEVRKFVKD